MNSMKAAKPKQVFIEGPIQAAFIAESIQKHSQKTEIGGHGIFLGQVRNDRIEDHTVVAIEYTTYEEMANSVLHQIREDAFARFNLTCLHIYHSLGTVKAGELSLFVFASSAHREAAMAACKWLVERIKNEVPIWGKEIFDDETTQWKVNQ